MNYYQITFDKVDQQQQELLIAVLSVEGYDGFEQSGNSLKAFINEKEFDETYLNKFLKEHNYVYSVELVKEQNWNSEWEKNFEPVIIDKIHFNSDNLTSSAGKNFVGLRAHFHKPIKNVEHEIIITPKMSFGTGHHSTTHLMISLMADIDFKDKQVMDFGTGTGVLAILAEKLGAAKVVAIDNDDWSIENARENILENQCKKIEIIKTWSPGINGPYGIILANINRNVIVENLKVLASKLEKGGVLLVSGLLEEEDRLMVSLKAQEAGFKLVVQVQRNNWNALKFLR